MKELISSTSDSSSKRYVMIGSFYALILMALLNQLFGLKVDMAFILTFAGLAGATGVMTVAEKKNGGAQ